MQNSNNLKVAVLTENGFEEVELTNPVQALKDAGATVHIISPQNEKVKAWDRDHWSIEIPVDKRLTDADPATYDALLLPGGVLNPDTLRQNPEAIAFVKAFFDEGKPVAAICHGPQTLINADVVKGRRMTSYPSIKQDLLNAGAEWIDQEVVSDRGLITSRNPHDIPAFNKKVVEEFTEHVQVNQQS